MSIATSSAPSALRPLIHNEVAWWVAASSVAWFIFEYLCGFVLWVEGSMIRFWPIGVGVECAGGDALSRASFLQGSVLLQACSHQPAIASPPPYLSTVLSPRPPCSPCLVCACRTRLFFCSPLLSPPLSPHPSLSALFPSFRQILCVVAGRLKHG